MRYGNHNTGKRIQIIFQDSHSRDIQIISWLIQEQDVRCLHQDFQKVQSSLLSSGKFFYRCVLHGRVKKKSLQHLGGGDSSFFRRNIFCHFANIIDHSLSSIHIRNVLGEISDADGFADLNFSGIRSNQSFYHLKEGGFSTAVGADDSKALIS